jgi:membrane-associated protease RseP (regulator of RpoE activity)
MNMNKIKKFTVLYIISLTFMGCSTPATRTTGISEQAVDAETRKQLEIRLATDLREHDRVMAVAYPLLKSSVIVCDDDVVQSLGFVPFNLDTLDKDVRPAATKLYGMGDTLQVITVPPGSSADRAGLKRGDKLLYLNDQTIASGADALKKWNEQSSKTLKVSSSVNLTISRENEHMQFPLEAEKICGYSIAETYSDSVNAFADGKNVVLSAGMLRFAQDDKELALVISHEIAHNAMDHMEAKKNNYAAGSLLDIAAALAGVNTGGAFGGIAAGAHSKGFEAEADYVGLYIMALSDIPIEDAPGFWRRMAATHPESTRRGGFLASHPATSERFVALENTIEEIHNKQASGVPLTPNMK